MRPNHSSIQRELAALKKQFDASQPAFEYGIQDPTLGVDGHIVVWNTANAGPLHGCAKGGTRIRPGLTREEVRMLARTMALKNAVAGLPLGGAKSGLNANPDAPGFEQRYRRFITLSKPYLYENGGAYGGFGFDIGARAQHALWACDELQSLRSFTGKPLHMGGTDYDRQGIAGLGVASAARALVQANNDNTAKQQFAVHGVGALGAALIRYLAADNWQLCAVGDPRLGGSWRIDECSAALLAALTTNDIAKACRLLQTQAELVSDDPNSVLFQACDVLLPCALQHAIHADNVAELHCRYIVEGANSPVSEAAYSLLQNRGITVVPDFVANAGGVIAAYTEMIATDDAQKNLTESLTENLAEQAKRATGQRISANVGMLFRQAQAEHSTVREAALLRALRQLSAQQ